jgi:tetratricopeptide (TPR) repeat protein
MSFRMRWGASVVLPFFLTTAVGSRAVAQDARPPLTDAQKAQIKDHYQRGKVFYDIAKYGEAIEEYQKAYLISPDPVMLFNIAQAYRNWDKPEEAARFYRNYLRNAPTATNRADVEKRIAEMEKLVEERRRSPTTTTTPPPVGTPPPVVTEPAPVTPPAPVPGPVATTPPPPATTPPPVDTASPVTVTDSAPTTSEGGGGRRIAGWTLVGVGGALVVTSAVLGRVARSRAQEVEDTAAMNGRFDPAVERSGKAANAGAIGAGLLGVAAGVTGLILLVTGRESSASAATGPAGALARTPVYPIAAPGLAGAGARITF